MITWAQFQYKNCFPGIGFPMIKIWQFHNSLFHVIRNHMMIRSYRYTETAPLCLQCAEGMYFGCWDPFHQRFFHHNSNSMEISFSFNSITGDHIAKKFGTCHDSPAVVPCAKYCSDHYIIIWMRAKWNFHHIWIVMEKLLVKWAPDKQSHSIEHTGM